MNLKSSNKVDKNHYELEIEVNAEDFDKAIEKSYKKNIKKFSIPGFRKGKASRKFVEKYYGEKVFYEDAVNDICPKALSDAIDEADLEFVNDKIDFDIVSIGKDGIDFKAVITVKPEVEISGYKDIKVQLKPVEVTDDDINKEINKVRERNARLIAVEDRPSQAGDVVTMDFKGYIDGSAFKGGEANDYKLTIGKNKFIPGFEDQLIGHKSGDEFEVNVNFPDDYSEPYLAGKPAVFKVKLHEIKSRELPDFDDEFVKDVSEFDTIDQYKESIKKQLISLKKRESEIKADDEMTDKIVELLKADIPDAMFNNRLGELIQDFDYKLQSQGLNLNYYMEYTGVDERTLASQFMPSAEKQVKLRLAFEKIASLENIVATEEDIESKYKTLADYYKADINEVKKHVSKKDLIRDIIAEKVIDFLHENCIIKN